MFGKRFVSASIFAAWTAVVYLQAAALSQTSLPSSEKATSRARPIVLRDLTLIRDDPIRSFDERGVVLKHVGARKNVGARPLQEAEDTAHLPTYFRCGHDGQGRDGVEPAHDADVGSQGTPRRFKRHPG